MRLSCICASPSWTTFHLNLFQHLLYICSSLGIKDQRCVEMWHFRINFNTHIRSTSHRMWDKRYLSSCTSPPSSINMLKMRVKYQCRSRTYLLDDSANFFTARLQNVSMNFFMTFEISKCLNQVIFSARIKPVQTGVESTTNQPQTNHLQNVLAFQTVQTCSVQKMFCYLIQRCLVLKVI